MGDGHLPLKRSCPGTVEKLFCGLPAKNFDQLKALKKFLNSVLHKNTTKAKDSKAPLGYSECKRMANESLGEGVTK